MSNTHTPGGFSSKRKPGLERSLQRLLQSRATRATIKAELTGAAAEAWHELEAAAQPLNLSHEHLLGLVIEQAMVRVKQALTRELQRLETAGS